ncbi:ABC transporter ATP-binding protein [Plantactinospora soyae]|uniref:Branched-chain amino acid transport system ATP-binding protein n=1 Tax=Plantactinospora soyae TaxID=1544732 RepID=A0A927M7S9_9ACTN|nr:ATP-binding cassette domain-containing protein [Plantactinospora soyae]MBE1489549.1 branched-chain amino acid transport system ATP-binding protein [Plantactinospora soyae]
MSDDSTRLPAALELTGFSAYHGSVAAANDVSFRVERGSAVGVLGPNGAGKSTLLLAAAGFVRTTGGLSIAGQVADRLSPARRRRLGLAMVPQERAAVLELSVAENLRLSWLTGRRATPYEQARESVLEIFPALAGRLGDPAGNLSGGQRQMLAVSRGLMATCDVLLLDEPTAGLSPKLISELVQAIRTLNERGITVLLVEQNFSVVERTCSYIHVLNGGRIVWHGPTTGIDRDSIGDLYSGARRTRPPAPRAPDPVGEPRVRTTVDRAVPAGSGEPEGT